LRNLIVAICIAIMALALGLGSATSLAAEAACGSVVGFAGGSGLLLITISSGTTTVQYRLAQPGTAPVDIGDLFSRKTPQLLAITGTLIAPDTGSPQAINLTNFTVTRVTSCTLPSTSTNAATSPSQSPPVAIGILSLAVIILGGLVYAQRRRSSAASDL
jgi:hypothetical protein